MEQQTVYRPQNKTRHFNVGRLQTLNRIDRLKLEGERSAETVDRVLIEYERFLLNSAPTPAPTPTQ